MTHKACSPDCAEILAGRDREKKARQATRAQKAKLKRRADWMREAQTAFNKFVRERDRIAGYRCISSGSVLDWTGNKVDAGHFRSIGAAPHLRFNEDNCHAQSKQDNRYLAGNAVDYRIGLIARIGIARVEALESDNAVKKFSVEELKTIKEQYRMKLKELRDETNDRNHERTGSGGGDQPHHEQLASDGGERASDGGEVLRAQGHALA
jgi:hypothetical protein